MAERRNFQMDFNQSETCSEVVTRALGEQLIQDKGSYFTEQKGMSIAYTQILGENITTYSYEEIRQFNNINISNVEYLNMLSDLLIKEEALKSNKQFENLKRKFKLDKKYKIKIYNKIMNFTTTNSNNSIVGRYIEKLEQEPNLFFDKISLIVDYTTIEGSDYDYLYYIFSNVDGKIIISIYEILGNTSTHLIDFISYNIEGKYYYISVYSSKKVCEKFADASTLPLAQQAIVFIDTLLDINVKLRDRSYTKEYISSFSNKTPTKSNSKSYTRKTVYKLDDLLNTKIYINNKDDFRLPRGYNRKTDVWNVMGYYRHYKSGKVVFVKPHVRGDKSKKITGRTIKLS